MPRELLARRYRTQRTFSIVIGSVAVLALLVGGIAGIIVGAVVSIGISSYAGWKTRVSPTAVLLAFVVSFIVGLVFGLYPAMKAAALEPVDAMRYE